MADTINVLTDSTTIITDSIPYTLSVAVNQIPDTAMSLENTISETFDMAGKSLGIDKLLDFGYEKVITFGTRLILAIIVLLIGLYVIKLLVKAFKKILIKRNVDESLQPFFKGLVSIGLKIMLIVSVMGMVGIEMTSFIAVLGAAGLAFGMALSGTLQNFAGGVILLIFKPFKAGDYVETQGYSGLVKEVRIFNTIIVTFDNKTVIIPNGGLSSSSMINYTAEPLRRVDWTISTAYGGDVDKAKKIISDLLEKDDKVLKDPKHFILLGSLAESSVDLYVRAWVKTSDYWDVLFNLNENVYREFNEQGVSFPFPQMDVHLHDVKK
ncbi:MAG: mechanosensitive ion channel domain-containing protein [Bacteroidota bacterium]